MAYPFNSPSSFLYFANTLFIYRNNPPPNNKEGGFIFIGVWLEVWLQGEGSPSSGAHVAHQPPNLPFQFR